MLPKPHCVFTVPSLHDGLDVDGRLYFPILNRSQATSLKGFAIFAHPYAPLGGSWDDPVVNDVGYLLLRCGFILSTFNFRGAKGSMGKTSWTGNAELGDFTALYALILYFMNTQEVCEYLNQREETPESIFLILGGYSYGSMMASHLPKLEILRDIMVPVKAGSPGREIQLRAQELSKAFSHHLASQTQRSRNNSRLADTISSPNASPGVAVGGYEPGTKPTRVSRESSRHSLDVELVRHGIDKIKHRLGSKSSSQLSPSSESLVAMTDLTVLPTIAYLIVSPILPPVSGFVTMFSRLKFKYRDDDGVRKYGDGSDSVIDSLSRSPSLAIFGDKDMFTSVGKLRKWASSISQSLNSQFTSKEISGASHFWQEEGVLLGLHSAIEMWLNTISSHQDRRG